MFHPGVQQIFRLVFDSVNNALKVTLALPTAGGGELLVADFFDTSLIHGSVSVTTSEIQAKVGVSNLADRRFIRVFNSTNGKIYYGATGLSTSDSEFLQKGEAITLPAGPNIDVF